MHKNEAVDVITNRLNDLIYLQKRQGADAEKIAKFEAERDAIIAKVKASDDNAFSAVEWRQNNYPAMAQDIGRIIGGAA